MQALRPTIVNMAGLISEHEGDNLWLNSVRYLKSFRTEILCVYYYSYYTTTTTVKVRTLSPESICLHLLVLSFTMENF